MSTADVPTRSRAAVHSSACGTRSNLQVAPDGDGRGDRRKPRATDDEDRHDNERLTEHHEWRVRRCRAQVTLHEEVHDGDDSAAREHRPEEGRDNTLKDERRLDETVGCAYEPHDPEFASATECAQPYSRGD